MNEAEPWDEPVEAPLENWFIEGILVEEDPFWGELFVPAQPYLEKVFPALNRLLSEAGCGFFAYGSRSKTLIDPTNTVSDWDFAVSVFDEDKLPALGFVKREGEVDYRDPLTKAVYQRELDGHKIQVIVKNRLDLFKIIWSEMGQGFWEDFVNKRSETYLGKEGVRSLFSLLFYTALVTERQIMNGEGML